MCGVYMCGVGWGGQDVADAIMLSLVAVLLTKLSTDCVKIGAGPSTILNMRDWNKPQLRFRIKSKPQKQLNVN
jgi:hypothetical protein